ncbi:MAG TPA: hypothetical protein VGB85_28240, partial [Nannocystis sp.]
MTGIQSTARLLLALAPLLGLASACDKAEPVDKQPVADSKGDTEGDSESASPTTTEGDDSEGDPETTSTSDPLPEDECGWFLVGMTPDEISAAWTEAQSFGAPEQPYWCEGEHSMPCTTAEGMAGTSLCVWSWGEQVWTTCAVEHACTPDTTFE